jgi:hypothetical protein
MSHGFQVQEFVLLGEKRNRPEIEIPKNKLKYQAVIIFLGKCDLARIMHKKISSKWEDYSSLLFREASHHLIGWLLFYTREVHDVPYL